MMDSPYSGKPDVSVLMSCYNAARWLAEAIDSVLAQTFRNFEFIIVNDGSTDDTWSIIEDYRGRDERIVAVSKKNTGLQDSLNVGLALAKGEWIARLDADDLCEPTRFEEQLDFVRKHDDVVLLGTGCLEIDEDGRVIKMHDYPTGHRSLTRRLERIRPFFPHSSAFYRTETARRAGGYNVRIRRAEDWRLWLEMSMQGQIACLPKPLIRFRKHAGQISYDGNGRRQVYDGIAATASHFLRKAGYEDPSAAQNPADWSVFLKWIEDETDRALTFQRFRSWEDARVVYYSAGNRFAGIIRFSRKLWQSGHAGPLLWKKMFGTSMPERLAKEWMKTS